MKFSCGLSSEAKRDIARKEMQANLHKWSKTFAWLPKSFVQDDGTLKCVWLEHYEHKYTDYMWNGTGYKRYSWHKRMIEEKV